MGVYKIKYHADKEIERLNARLIIFCNHQEGIDYNETFALVTKMENVCTFLTVAVAKN